MRLVTAFVIAGLFVCLTSSCNSAMEPDGSQANQALPGGTQGSSLGQDSGADDLGPMDPVAVNPVRPVGALARPPSPFGQGDSSTGADPAFGTGFDDEETAPGILEPGVDQDVFGAGDTMLTSSFVNAWTFPFFEAALMADELSLLTDGLVIDLLSPSPPVSPGPPASTFTRLERLCIASGELEFICRQRYGR